MNNKNNLDLSKLLTDETIEIFEDIINGPIKTGEGSYKYNIEFPPTSAEIREMINNVGYKLKPKDNVVIYTGIEGKVNYQEQLVKYVGGTFTEEDKDKYRQELINSGQTIFKL